MRDSSRDCYACSGRTGCAIWETPRCERCGQVYCEYCMPVHLADEHPTEDRTPVDDDELPIQYHREQVRGWLRDLDERIERAHPGYVGAGWTAILRKTAS